MNEAESTSNGAEPTEASATTSESGAIGFGPLDGLRALTNLQRQGITAATEVAERFTALLDGFARPRPLMPDLTSDDADHDGEPRDPGADADAMGELRSNVARGFDLYSRMFQTTFESWADLVEDRMRDRGISLGASGADTAAAVGAPGGTATGELWLHNHGEAEVGPFRLIATPAFSAEGQSISPAAFTLEPAMLTVPASSSSRVEITVDLGDQADEGTLHAMVLVIGLPDEALPLRVIVRSESPNAKPADEAP